MTEDTPPPPRIGPAAVTYMVAIIAGIAIWSSYRPGGWALAATIAAPVAALFWLARQAFLRRRASNCRNPAQRAYVRRSVPLMIAYVAALFVAIRLHDTLAPT